MGTVKLVGADPQTIERETHLLLTDPHVYQAMAKATNPYGDGYAAERILNICRAAL
jgi:UDP-N-acetylglucosamine 2-epimerase (non-hydrolysing)